MTVSEEGRAPMPSRKVWKAYGLAYPIRAALKGPARSAPGAGRQPGSLVAC